MATIANIDRCVVNGNTIINDQTNADFRLVFILDDQALPRARINVSGNVFGGYTLIEPQRFPGNTSLTYPLNSWDFLNTEG